MDEDIQSVVDTDEQVVEQSVDTYEDQAREQGWRPREEYQGDPNKWRPAKEFVDRMIKLGHGAMLEHGTIYLKIDKTTILEHIANILKKDDIIDII